MRALQIKCAALQAMVKHLCTRMATDSKDLKKFKDALRLLNGEVNDYKAQLEGGACRVEELTKANTNLTIELATLCEQVDKTKANAVEEFKDSQPYFVKLGDQYDEGFEDFRKLAIASFPSLDYSQIQIGSTVLMTPHGGNVIVEVENGATDRQVEAEKASLTNQEDDSIRLLLVYLCLTLLQLSLALLELIFIIRFVLMLIQKKI